MQVLEEMFEQVLNLQNLHIEKIYAYYMSNYVCSYVCVYICIETYVHCRSKVWD